MLSAHLEQRMGAYPQARKHVEEALLVFERIEPQGLTLSMLSTVSVFYTAKLDARPMRFRFANGG